MIPTTIAKILRQFLISGLRDELEAVTVLPLSSWCFDDGGNSFTRSLLSTFNYWDLLPVATTVTAVSDKYTLLLGSNTPLATQSTKGGLTLTTGATSTNLAGVGGIAATGFAVPIETTNNIVFRTRVNLASVATMWATAGLSQTSTAAGVPVAVAAIDQAQFLADPTNALVANTGATAAQALNWILCTNVAGTCAYIFTSIPIVALVDYQLQINGIQSGSLALWQYSINGNVVGTSVAGATIGTAVKPVIGVETTANATAAMDVRYAQLERSAGQ